MPRWAEETLTLDKRDNLRTVLAKVQVAEGGAPVILLSPSCKVADNPLTYRLLARASEGIASPIAVVSSNPRWRQLAREHGLHAYASLGALRRSGSQPSLFAVTDSVDSFFASLLPSIHGHWIAAVVVAVLVLAIGGTAAYFGLPVMRVTVQAPVETVSREVTVSVDSSVRSVDQEAKLIPGRSVEHRFAISDFVETTGQKAVGKEPARGEVAITNNGLLPVTLPAASVLVTASGQRFKTLAAVTVPALRRTATPAPMPSSPSSTPAAQSVADTTAKVGVQAVDPGEKGNVAARAINRLENQALRDLTVTNERPLAGGVDGKTKTVSAEDRARLKESLFQRAQSQSLSELTVRVRQSESLIPHSMQVRIEKEEYDKAQDEESDRLKGTIQISATGMTFANQDFNGFAEAEWKRSMGKSYRVLPGVIDFSPPVVMEATGRAASLKSKVSGRAERVVEMDKLTQGLSGLTAQQARANLAQADVQLKLMKVEIWPDWASKAYRVEVVTVQ